LEGESKPINNCRLIGLMMGGWYLPIVCLLIGSPVFLVGLYNLQQALSPYSAPKNRLELGMLFTSQNKLMKIEPKSISV
jgi:hypothetical protein